MALWWSVAFVVGACVGSFLNVCIWRLPRDQSIVRPRSRCPACSHPIAWYDNIPLLSFALLGGRCRHCRGPIHWRYPLVEALSGALAVAVLQRFGLTAVGVVYLLFVWVLVAISFIDLEHRIIPAELSMGGLVAGWILSGLFPQLHGAEHALLGIGYAVFGSLIGAGLLYLTGSLGSFVFRKDAMGLGDVDLLAMAGAVLGWKLVTLTFFLAPLLAVGPGLAVLAIKRSHEIPYGPFLSLGLIISLFAGKGLLQMTGIEETIRLLWFYAGTTP